MSESVAPPMGTNTPKSGPPAKEDFGLESISEELPIAEPENPSFKSQVRFRAPMPSQPKRPGVPQANMKPAVNFPIPRAMGPEPRKNLGIPQANVKRALKFPIPQAMGPELPENIQKKPEDTKAAKAPARPVPRAHKPLEMEDLRVFTESDGVKPALRQVQKKTVRELKLKTISLMEQCLYHTQDGNMLNVEAMAIRYQMTKQYRMAFICLKMEEVKNEMHSMYSFLYKNLQNYHKDYDKLHIKIVKQIYYYTHMLKRNIDITYAIEYLLEHFSEM